MIITVADKWTIVFSERNKNPPRIEWRKLFAEVEADAIAGGTFCPMKPRGEEKGRKRERERERMKEDGESGWWFREEGTRKGRTWRNFSLLPFYEF